MSQPTVVDLAILGGGCAGLSLARELASELLSERASGPDQSQVNCTVAVIEPRTTYEDDRSWCFWASDEVPASDSIFSQIHHRWQHWRFGLADQPVDTRQSPGLSYQYLRSADFYQACSDSIAANDSVHLYLGQTVQTVLPVTAGWQITTNTQTFIAREVVDTRPPPPEQRAQATLQQVFLGVEIELATTMKASTDSVELMTDMRLVNGEFCFTYVLPYSTTRLLVEVTFFARKIPDMAVLETTLKELLAARGWSDARIVRRESASLPMGLPDVADKPGQPVRAGMGGGALRASSGYGFLRIQRWAKRCAAHYLATGDVVGHPKPGIGWQWMDQLFLDVLANEPALAPDLFDRLLGRTEPARFVRFMNDEATLVDCLKVIGCLPKRPFLRALGKRVMPKRLLATMRVKS